jgi:hypothetical protein
MNFVIKCKAKDLQATIIKTWIEAEKLKRNKSSH